MKGKPKLHILYKYQLNIYLTVNSVAKKMNKIDHISVRDIKTILKNAQQISEFGHQIF